MPKAHLYDIAGERIGEGELSESMFGIAPKKYGVHDWVQDHRAN